MIDYTRGLFYPIVGEPTPEARFREEYERTARKPEAERTVRQAIDPELIIARYVQRAASFFRFA